MYLKNTYLKECIEIDNCVILAVDLAIPQNKGKAQKSKSKSHTKLITNELQILVDLTFKNAKKPSHHQESMMKV